MLVLYGTDLLQLLEVMTALGQFSYGVPLFSFAYLLFSLSAYQLPQFSTAQLRRVESYLVHSSYHVFTQPVGPVRLWHCVCNRIKSNFVL